MKTNQFPFTTKIDYITISSRYKTSVKDARSWAGCTLPSDHRLVTMDLIIHPNNIDVADTTTTILPLTWRSSLRTGMYRRICRVYMFHHSCPTPHIESSWVQFGAVLQEAAKETIGLKLLYQVGVREKLQGWTLKLNSW